MVDGTPRPPCYIRLSAIARVIFGVCNISAHPNCMASQTAWHLCVQATAKRPTGSQLTANSYHSTVFFQSAMMPDPRDAPLRPFHVRPRGRARVTARLSAATEPVKLGGEQGEASPEAVPQLDFRMPITPIGPTTSTPADLKQAFGAPNANPVPPSVLGPDLGKLAHELRTPLAAIVALAEVMRDEQFGALGNARYKGYANDIHQSARHALAVLTAMLDAGPGANGHSDPRGRMSFERVELNALARGCVSGLQPVAAKSRVHLRTALNPHLLALTADRRSLKQIVLNLLANALRFTPAGGTITVVTAVVAEVAPDGKGYFRIDVRDTGTGMTSAEIADVLGRDIDRPAGPAEPGNPAGQSPDQGVGLPLARALAEAHNGTISIVSEPGAGTTVSVRLPSTSGMKTAH
jgi:hypothetical protein